MTDPLVVQFRPEARQAFQRRASSDPARRGRAAIVLAVLVTGLVLVPWIAVNAVQGFEPRSLLLLALLGVPAALVRWGRRTMQTRPVGLGAVAFVIGEDEVRVNPYPSANSALDSHPEAVWPTAATSVQVRSSPLGDRLVLRGPGAQRRTYPVGQLDTAPEVIAARLAGS